MRRGRRRRGVVSAYSATYYIDQCWAAAFIGHVKNVDTGALIKHFARHMRSRPNARSEEHTSELQSLMRISYAVFCLKKKRSQSAPQYHNAAYHDEDDVH